MILVSQCQRLHPRKKRRDSLTFHARGWVAKVDNLTDGLSAFGFRGFKSTDHGGQRLVQGTTGKLCDDMWRHFGEVGRNVVALY